MWRLHLQHHDGDDDCENTVTEGFHASFIHSSYPNSARTLATREKVARHVCAHRNQCNSAPFLRSHLDDFFEIFLNATKHVHEATHPRHTPGQSAKDSGSMRREICVVTCVVTLRSMPVSRALPSCRSGTRRRGATMSKPA